MKIRLSFGFVLTYPYLCSHNNCIIIKVSMAARLRFKVVDEAFKRAPVYVEQPLERPSEYFGKHVFNRQKMYKYLPAEVYEKMCELASNSDIEVIKYVKKSEVQDG